MNVQLIHQNPLTYVIIFDTGDEVVSGLQQFATKHEIKSASLEAIGALQRCTVGYFDWNVKDYRKIQINEQVEVLSLLGNFAMSEGKAKLHAHLVVGKSDASAHGGHLLEAIVRPTLEVIVTELPEHLQRHWNKEAHLALIEI